MHVLHLDLQVDTTSENKLHQPLLHFHEESTPDVPLLAVNFDPALVRLLRETKYFLLLKIEVGLGHGLLADLHHVGRVQNMYLSSTHGQLDLALHQQHKQDAICEHQTCSSGYWLCDCRCHSAPLVSSSMRTGSDSRLPAWT